LAAINSLRGIYTPGFIGRENTHVDRSVCGSHCRAQLGVGSKLDPVKSSLRMNAAFDLARQLTCVTSPSEFFELSAAHMRKQLETFTEQTKQLTTLAQKVTTEAAQPLEAGIAKTFKKNT
jgi:hypothetical protein